jgi:hypothetical protein
MVQSLETPIQASDAELCVAFRLHNIMVSETTCLDKDNAEDSSKADHNIIPPKRLMQRDLQVSKRRKKEQHSSLSAPAVEAEISGWRRKGRIYNPILHSIIPIENIGDR